MAHITRIKARESGEPRSAKLPEPPKKAVKAQKAVKAKEVTKPQKAEKPAKAKKPFLLFRPFIALGRYLRDSWRELRQVRWPNRKVTWKMVLAVFVYTVIFVTFLILLDLLFEWIFSLILK